MRKAIFVLDAEDSLIPSKINASETCCGAPFHIESIPEETKSERGEILPKQLLIRLFNEKSCQFGSFYPLPISAPKCENLASRSFIAGPFQDGAGAETEIIQKLTP